MSSLKFPVFQKLHKLKRPALSDVFPDLKNKTPSEVFEYKYSIDKDASNNKSYNLADLIKNSEGQTRSYFN